MTHCTPAGLWPLAACESLGPTCCANTLGRRFPQAALCCQLFQLYVVTCFSGGTLNTMPPSAHFVFQILTIASSVDESAAENSPRRGHPALPSVCFFGGSFEI